MICFASQGLHFGIESRSPNHVFARHLHGHPSLRFYFDFMIKWKNWGPLQNPVGVKMPPQIFQIPVLRKCACLFPALKGFIRNLFLQSSPGPSLHICWSISASILLNVAFRWARFGKALPSKFGSCENGPAELQERKLILSRSLSLFLYTFIYIWLLGCFSIPLIVHIFTYLHVYIYIYMYMYIYIYIFELYIYF